jgi:hypothetical protein
LCLSYYSQNKQLLLLQTYTQLVYWVLWRSCSAFREVREATKNGVFKTCHWIFCNINFGKSSLLIQHHDFVYAPTLNGRAVDADACNIVSTRKHLRYIVVLFEYRGAIDSMVHCIHLLSVAHFLRLEVMPMTKQSFSWP